MKSTKSRKSPFVAYQLMADPCLIEPASRTRQWMSDSSDRFAYRCLPLVIANQLGWDILCPVSFEASWNGNNTDLDSIKIEFLTEETSTLISSHFGNGVMTFTLGYLFRTPKNHNIWVKGPANMPKDGIAPLEGIIEADWAPYTFTMNWKFTRADHSVTFTKGEPIARILPYPRHYLNNFTPKIKHIQDNEALFDQYKKWNNSRRQFIDDLQVSGSDAQKQKWQRDYMQGRDQDDKVHKEHQTKLAIPPFSPLKRDVK